MEPDEQFKPYLNRLVLVIIPDPRDPTATRAIKGVLVSVSPEFLLVRDQADQLISLKEIRQFKAYGQDNGNPAEAKL